MNKQYMKEIIKILQSEEINLYNKKYDFNGARRAIFNSPTIVSVMKKNGINKTYEISSGVSDKKAFTPYLKQVCQDLIKETYYRNYYVNRGEETSRAALAFYENLKFKDSMYEDNDICLTEGSTGAISAIIEYFARKYPKGEVLITNPCYYLYKSACKYYGIKYKEVSLFNQIKNRPVSFTSIASLMKAFGEKTKLVIINNPFNPSGELYTKKDLSTLIREAKKREIFILVDELFQDLVFNPSQFFSSDLIAEQVNAMKNLVVVKGYSKNKNLVALRMGYVFSKNKELIENVGKINQVRQSFPTASNYAGLIGLDAFVQSVLQIAGKNKNLKLAITKVRQTFPTTEVINQKSDAELLRLIKEYDQYFSQLMNTYSDSYDMCFSLLRNESSYCMPKISAFNTFFKIPSLDTVNMFDFTLNLYITTGVKIEIGPCFGFSQKEWESQNNLGFWLRITFAKDRETLKKGINKLISFIKEYRNKEKVWIQTNLTF